MGYENLNIELRGINNSSTFESLIREIAENIHWQSPSDSCLKIVCEQSKEVVKASCRIASQAGVFVAEAASDCPERSLRILEQKIQQKLNLWKQSRFSSPFDNQLETAS